MTTEARRVLEAALALSAEDRRQLGEALLDSAAQDLDDEVGGAWRVEVLQRIEGLRRGEVRSEPWSEVKQHIAQARER